MLPENVKQSEHKFEGNFNFNETKHGTSPKVGKQKIRKTNITTALEESTYWTNLIVPIIGAVADKILENTRGKGNYESFQLNSTEKKTIARAGGRLISYYHKSKPSPILLLLFAIFMIYAKRFAINFADDKLSNRRKANEPTYEPTETKQTTETTHKVKEIENNAEIEKLKKALEERDKTIEERDEKIKTLGNNNQKLSARNSGLIRRIKTAEKRELEKAEQSEVIRKESEQSEKS